MRKIWFLLLAAVMLLSLGACGKGPEKQWQEQYELGMKYVSEGDYEEAVLAFTAAIEIDPKRADTYLALADVYEAQGDWESLKAILEQGLAATEDNRLQERLDALQEETEDSQIVTVNGRPYVRVTVQGELFKVSEVYREKYQDYNQQYGMDGGHWFASSVYGIRFAEPVTLNLDGEEITVSEVNCNGFYGTREKMDLLDENGEIPAGVYVLEGLLGENEYPNDVSGEIAFHEEFDEYIFQPSGDYEFLIDTLEPAD